jgi:hypothetical protein
MAGPPRAIVLAEQIARSFAGALGWIVVIIGALGVLISLVGLFFGPEWRGLIGSLVTTSLSLLLISIGIYGNPKYRERILSSL